MEKQRVNGQEPHRSEILISDQRAQAVALALAAEKNRKANGKLDVQNYVRIVDEVRATHPTYANRPDALISIAKSSVARNNVVAALRKIITVLQTDTPEKYDPETRMFMENTFAQIKSIQGNPDLTPQDLYGVFSIEPAQVRKSNAMSSKSPLTRTSTTFDLPPGPEQNAHWGKDWTLGSEFMANLRGSFVGFIGDPNATETPPIPDEVED